MNYKGYKELECYIQAKLLRIFISELAKKFPAHEKFLLVSQIIDSSRSITRNIAEGYRSFYFAMLFSTASFTLTGYFFLNSAIHFLSIESWKSEITSLRASVKAF